MALNSFNSHIWYSHVLGPLYIIAWIKAKYEPSTRQELRYLSFELTKWGQEKNRQNFSEEVERLLFHPLSSRFLKENHFWGGSCVGQFGLFCPKGVLGSQKHVEGILGVCEENCRFAKKFCEPTLSNLLLPAQAFCNLATRWRSSMPDPCNTMLIQTWRKGLKDCITTIYIF